MLANVFGRGNASLFSTCVVRVICNRKVKELKTTRRISLRQGLRICPGNMSIIDDVNVSKPANWHKQADRKVMSLAGFSLSFHTWLVSFQLKDVGSMGPYLNAGGTITIEASVLCMAYSQCSYQWHKDKKYFWDNGSCKMWSLQI